jgi:SH3-like domain-containing protein
MKIKLYAAAASTFCFAILCALLGISFSVSANDSAYAKLAQAPNIALPESAAVAVAPTKPVKDLEKKTLTAEKNTASKNTNKAATNNVEKTLDQAAISPKTSDDKKTNSTDNKTQPVDKVAKNDEASIKKPNGETNLPTPRFVSIKSDEVNVRAGPGDSYPIKWVIIKKELPVEIIQEFEHWRKIRDISGDEGWVHSAMVTGIRTAIILDKTWDITNKPEKTSKIIATIEKGVVVDINKCNINACEVRIENVDGWIERTALWGIYKNELIED